MDNKLELNEITDKNQALIEVKKYFKGNKRFINYCEIILASTFIGDEPISISLKKDGDNWNWEKILGFTLSYKEGFKMIHYRRGNKKYSKDSVAPHLEGNTTSDIHEFSITNYVDGKSESYTIQA
ncbi:hypothetical protein [Bacillus seohaeanensis]|uniref:Uncharacterized protein n=1 Tax=Bacillus seohaeanensis TaxID=284580 RepID=A0ABW5RSD8_9BACI